MSEMIWKVGRHGRKARWTGRHAQARSKRGTTRHCLDEKGQEQPADTDRTDIFFHNA